MALNYDLSNQQIKNTYEQLVQVSASALVDGTGSLVDSLDYVTNPTFTSYTSSTATSTSASIANLQTQIDSLEAGSGSADWPLITNKPEGLVSSSAQTIANLPSGTISGSSQVDLGSAIGTASRATLADEASQNFDTVSYSDATGAITMLRTNGGSQSATITNVPSLSSSLATDIATNKSDISTQTSRVDSLVSATSSYAVKTSDNSFTGTQTFDNIAVNGTASIGFLQQVTGSAKIIGDAFIQLNTDTPAQRYAGLQVVDSGSTADTSSLIWDSETNDWFYEYEGDDPTDHGILLFGPEYATKGSPTYNVNNKLVKGTGGHHLVDSSITDTGTSVSMSAPLTASGFQGDLDGTATSASFAITASFALNAAGGGLVAGTGTDSMKSADSLTASPAVASGDNTIAIGGGASATANNQIDIGGRFKYDGSDTIQLDSSNLLFNSSGTIGSGIVAINMGIEGGQVTADYSSVFGATYSNVTTGNGCIVGGYSHNLSSGTNNAIIGGGESCTINGGNYSAIFGGAANTISAGDTSFIVGGYQNQVTGGVRNGVIGGNAAVSNHNFSVLIGRQNFTSTAEYTTYVANLDASGSATISGSITLASEGVVNVASGSSTGSLIDNIHPAIASSSAQIKHIVTIDQTAYTTISGSGNVSDDTLYIISDATQTGVYDGDLNITGFLDVDSYISASGNVEVGGQVYSPTHAGSVASNTSSIDFNNGNFATLNLTAGTFLANPSNLKSGTTYTIILDSGSLISGHGSAFKFAGGTAPTYSDNTDVLTMVSDGTNLYATALTDFS